MAMLSDDLPAFVLRYLEEQGDHCLGLERIVRGGNNQAYRLHTGKGSCFLKSYFRHPQDPRDRLKAEYRFLKFCSAVQITAVPRPLAYDAAAGMALYSWVEGSPARAPLTSADITAACALLRELARSSSDARAAELEPAADACLRPQDHLLLAQRRVKALRTLLADSSPATLAGQARNLVETHLVPALAAAEKHARSFLATCPPAKKFLASPSDFGFHNALRTTEGLVFVDFEYAGLDDPVKAVCDFLCQPEIPVPQSCLPDLVKALDGFDTTALLAQVQALLPLHRIKWCCILLNDFKKLDAARRAFASPALCEEERLAEQLDKARNYCKVWCRF